MFYITLQQQLCGKRDIWYNFQDKKYSKKKNWNFVTLAQLTKYSCNTTKQSTKSMHLRQEYPLSEKLFTNGSKTEEGVAAVSTKKLIKLSPVDFQTTVQYIQQSWELFF